MRLLQFLNFEISGSCNLAQDHCELCPVIDKDRWDLLDRTHSINVPLVVDCIRAAQDRGFRGLVGFHFYNEPLLARTRIVQVLDEAPAKFVLWTNGELIKESMLPFLQRFEQIYISNYGNRDWSWLTGPRVTVLEGILDARKSIVTKPNTEPCYVIFNDLFIDHYGNGHPCCMDWKGELCLGNVRTDGFEKIMDNYVALRSRVAGFSMKPDAPEKCRTCFKKQCAIANLVPEIVSDIGVALCTEKIA